MPVLIAFGAAVAYPEREIGTDERPVRHAEQKSRCRELHPNLPILQLFLNLETAFMVDFVSLSGRSVLDSRGAATGRAVEC